MSAKQEILKRLQQRNASQTPLADRTRRYPDLTAQFSRALQAVQGEVWQVDSPDAAWQTAHQILKEADAKTLAAHRAELPPSDTAPAQRFPEFEWHFAGEENFRAACARADAGLTSADAALAETGTLVLTSGAARARLTSLLPPLHIVFLPQAKLVSDIFAWKQQRPDPLPANLIFISGPSKTGDIEQGLVVGVHGPRRFVVIVY